MQTTEIKRYAIVLLKGWWLIGLCTLAAGGLAVVVFGSQPPSYTAANTFAITQRDNVSPSVNERIVGTYTELIYKSPILEEVITSLGLDMTVEDLQNAINVSFGYDTLLVKVTVQAGDPEVAANIANELPRVLNDQGRILLAADRNASRAGLRVVEYAKPSADTSRSAKRKKIILVTFVGSMVAFGLLISKEYLDETIRSGEHVEEIADIPLLVSLPRLKNTAPKGQVISHIAPTSPAAEGFRLLRQQLKVVAEGAAKKDIRTITVASGLQGEGKSFVAANLAVVMAQDGQRVVLVDANLRRPTLHTHFGLGNEQGLVDLLSSEQLSERSLGEGGLMTKQPTAMTERAKLLSQVVQTTSVDNLTVLTSGPLPALPVELMTSSRMEELMSALIDGYDMVIFDTPPLLPVVDGLVVGGFCDMTILVAKVRATKVEILQQTQRRCERFALRPAGVVINRDPSTVTRPYRSARG